MGDDDVPVDGDQRHGEQGYRQQAISQHREEPAQQITVGPGPLHEGGGGQRKIEAAEEQVRAGQIDDEYGRGVACLAAPREGHDGQQVAGNADDDENDAGHPGNGQQLVRVALEELLPPPTEI